MEFIYKAEEMSGDRGYDDTRFTVKLWDDYGVKPIIDI